MLEISLCSKRLVFIQFKVTDPVFVSSSTCQDHMFWESDVSQISTANKHTENIPVQRIESSDVNKNALLEFEKEKVKKAVKKLTISCDSQIDHSKALKDTAKILNERRSMHSSVNLSVFDEQALRQIKEKILASETVNEIILVLTQSCVCD